MKRLDHFLTEIGLAPTRSKAQQLIEAGEVMVNVRGQWQSVTQSSFKADNLTAADVRLAADAQTLKYVSRGGLKLEHALKHLKLEVKGLRCLDAGLSTGGFADCLLQNGAASVFGFDVGHGQLHAKLESHPRLAHAEGLHVRDLAQHPQAAEWLRTGADLCVVDMSFISLTQVLPHLAPVLHPGSRLLALVKPQFETGAENLDGRGVVRDETLFDDVKSRVLHALAKYGFSIADYFPCAVKGQDGNQEFFAYARRSD